MTASITWSDLFRCYENIEFLSELDGELTIASEEIRKTIQLVDENDSAATDANLYPSDPLNNLKVGDKIKVHVGAPKLSIGILADDLDSLLHSPDGFIEVPQHFYIKSGRLSERDLDAVPLKTYRTVVALGKLLSEAATFMDRIEQKLFYFKEGKIELPVRFDSKILTAANTQDINRLLKQFNTDPLHRSQKLTILADTIAALVKPQPISTRFGCILQNIRLIATSLEDGYRLFVSSFSYDKIRNDLEHANLDFVSKIHKTFVDIQGQLLGIPIATIVVASQMKAATACGIELWTNVAVLAGAWIFALFLAASITNQILTLNAIGREVERQKKRLEGDFAAISNKFVDIFRSLDRRIFWYRLLYILVGLIGVAGAGFATLVYCSIMKTPISSCL